MEKKIIIVGAGLVGSLWAVYMRKAGYKVVIYERRSDIRKAEISAGKSINLALSARGWNSLNAAGIKADIEKIAIPMSGRIMHSEEGELTYQPYGKKEEAIYSVSRGHLNAIMMDLAEEKGNSTIHYNHQCLNADLKNGKITLKNLLTDEIFEDQADVVFAADGAYSAIRYNSMQKVDRFNFSQFYVEDGYKELLLPAGKDGSYQIEKNALHIWPRGRFMLIALPNEDGSFTCTLFMPYENHEHAFNDLDTDEKVDDFFKKVFPDFYDMMPNLVENWHQNPLSSMSITRCFPWTMGKFALLGDSAHATVPFYGQGMNAGFEDCFVMWELYNKCGNWKETFQEFQKIRKPDGDALQDLSLDNYYVMRDHVADKKFLLQKKIEAKLHKNYPDKWIPLYSQVSFSTIRYSEAYKNGKKQEKIMKEIMKISNIEEIWKSNEIEDKILSML
ncbi:MAG: NAD(P)/FAD-dependent oxidoreductase [Flavobacteriales bacterium]|jgi:kynurenine 3-monooxygenase|nr:NAD(P)/FAD-dependent oxidoreductase [Flavobacteriales bacterium]MDG1440219.1 NAD(P)/FAD-dependent oxidoreductase [Flavobacteriales bacterium]MDG1798732.1 NAD(P)/FAD-dependent oxidoreductase [Flavobacteriales bacterium]